MSKLPPKSRFVLTLLASLFFFLFSTQGVLADFKPAEGDPDINIRLRGNPAPASPTLGGANLIDVSGPTDSIAPQLSTLVGDGVNTNPSIDPARLFQIRDYNGSAPIPANNTTNWGVTLMGLNASGTVKVPVSGYDIGKGYQAIVLYATNNDVVINYTSGEGGPNGSPIEKGYTLHILNLNTNSEIVDLYNQAKAKKKYIALPCGYNLGSTTPSMIFTIRDTGSFMDPRTRKDWWQSPPTTCANLPPLEIEPGESPGAPLIDPNKSPIPEPYVACGETRPDFLHPDEKEFNSLRPYQASPCDTGVHDTVIYCGNDFILKKSIIVTPEAAMPGTCVPTDNGGQKCHFEASQSAWITISFPESELPIMGNTEDVLNSANKINNLGAQKRMEEYVSWFLNGVPFRAEETPGKLNDSSAATGSQDLGRYALIDFAGPLRKLLSRDSQETQREKQVADAGTVRHNQIVDCLVLGKSVPCYQGIFAALTKERVKSTTTGGKGYSDKTASYVPFSSTEDRVGQVTVPDPELTTGQPQSDVAIHWVSFNPTIVGNTTESLFFAHMQESKELSTLLQNTFIPTGVEAVGDPGSQAYYNTERCEKSEKATNPGDKLFGDTHLEEVESKLVSITGIMSFVADFDCEFAPDRFDPTCFNQCMAAGDNEEQCRNQCTKFAERTCKKDALAAMSVFTRTPEIHSVWERLVDGDFSVFKRMYPKGFTQIKDIPGYTTAKYSAVSMSSLGGPIESEKETVLAGEPAMNRPGEQAEIFFPHLGSIQEYFLYGIQKALRPFGGPTLAGLEEDVPDSCEINCNQSVADSEIPAKFLGQFKANFIDRAKNLRSGDGKTHAEECYNDVVKQSLAAKINPAFTLAIWLHESGASNYSLTGAGCGIEDFGFHIPSNPSLKANFEAQIARFLGLPTLYTDKYDQCFPNGPSMEGFMQLFRSGLKADGSCVPPSSAAAQYLNNIKEVFGWIAPNCSFPKYPYPYPASGSCP